MPKVKAPSVDFKTNFPQLKSNLIMNDVASKAEKSVPINELRFCRV